jgi:hypothetical protein
MTTRRISKQQEPVLLLGDLPNIEYPPIHHSFFDGNIINCTGTIKRLVSYNLNHLGDYLAMMDIRSQTRAACYNANMPYSRRYQRYRMDIFKVF